MENAMMIIPILNDHDARDGDGHEHSKRCRHRQWQPEREQRNRHQRLTEAKG
jgi:hypothetical protein